MPLIDLPPDIVAPTDPDTVLHAQLDLGPEPLMVGTTAPVTLTLALAPGLDVSDLVLTLPVPNGVTLLPTSPTTGKLARARDGLTWQIPALRNAPASQTLGYGFTRQWTYDAVGRPTRSWLPGVIDRSYAYDATDNLTILNNDLAGEVQTQSFIYDHRNRLTQATGGPAAGITYNESYTYNLIDNLTGKAGVSYSYPASGANSTRPHAPSSIGGVAQTYEASGNVTSDGLRTYTWDGANRLQTATTGQATPLTFGPSQISHALGRADGDGWSANVTQDSTGYLLYGPPPP